MGLDRLTRLTRDYDVRLDWRPFFLRPNMPEGGMALTEMLPAQYIEEGHKRLRAVTAEAGMPFAPPDWVANTRLAHEAAAFARAHDQGDEFHRAVLRARFAEGRDIGDAEVLAEIGASLGLDRAALEAALRARSYREAVEQELQDAYHAGISGVPAFEFGPGAVLSGAQPYAVFERVMGALGVPRR